MEMDVSIVGRNYIVHVFNLLLKAIPYRSLLIFW